MSDIPEDLSAVGTHRGNPSPNDIGQTVGSPEGPDPEAQSAQPAAALFQVVRASSGTRIQVRIHPPRAQVPPPEDETEEMGQFRTVEGLRDALSDASIEGWIGVFEDEEADRTLTDEVTPDHPWIGQDRYRTVTLFADPEAAAAYAEPAGNVESSRDPS